MLSFQSTLKLVECKVFLTMVYNTQNHWVCGFSPPPEVLNNWKKQRFGNWV
jgi:hypothetical protein